MDSVGFCYWLQGLFENNPDLDSLSEAQIETIRKRLNRIVPLVDDTKTKPPVMSQPYPHKPTFGPARC